MALNVAGLQQVADKKRQEKSVWSPLSSEDFEHLAEGSVLAFDQSLAATGFVHLSYSGSRFFIPHAQTLRTTTTEGKGGHEESLDRALIQYRAFRALLEEYQNRAKYVVVHEMVPVGGGKLYSPESSLLAAHSLRVAVAELEMDLVLSVAPREHRKVICGNAKADKREAHAALAQTAERLDILNREAITNDNTRDALCIGLAYLRRLACG